jgi:uncharacterized protein (DUF2062 family)
MPRKTIRRLLPDPHAIREHKSLRLVSARLHDPNLWHLNRHSVSVAALVGVFVAFLPMPMQMLTAAAGAIWLRCNITLAVALVWLTNPLTMPPVFYATYRVGSWMMGIPADTTDFEFSIDWLQQSLADIWAPLWLGSVTCGALLGTAAYLAMRLVWRVGVQLKWRARLAARRSNPPR